MSGKDYSDKPKKPLNGYFKFRSEKIKELKQKG